MGKKTINWKTKGMNKDMSVSAFNPEFAFENVNLRLATNEGNTMLSWVNERGTKELTLRINLEPWKVGSTYSAGAIEGSVVGTAVIDHKLVVFTHEDGVDRIYVLWYSGAEKEAMEGKMLYKGDLNLSVSNPLETMVDYETDYVQKVYWTDGINQPRFINIAADEEYLRRWNEIAQENCATPFDFVPSFDAKALDVTITKEHTSGGLFAPGVIQYCFTYVNKHGQQSNIVYVSTLHYLGMADRGASPEEKVSSVFRITIEGADKAFDYVRLYSIQRTSLDAVPLVKMLGDIPVADGISYIDNGTTGSTVDPTEMLYLGGKEITALTMAAKDNTLFLGNITQKNVLIDSVQEAVGNMDIKIGFAPDGEKTVALGKDNNVYFYHNTLQDERSKVTTFKGGEVYRFGFQLQKADGEWSEPIYLDDVKNDYYPGSEIDAESVKLVSANAEIPIAGIAAAYNATKGEGEKDFYSVFTGIRPVMVYPTISDRNVLCQGVINPTVFNVEDRKDGTPFAQASWFFRPYHGDGIDGGITGNGGSNVIEAKPNSVSISDGSVSDDDLKLKGVFADMDERMCYVLVGDVLDSDYEKYIKPKGRVGFWLQQPVEIGGGQELNYLAYDGVIKLQANKYAFFFDEGKTPPDVMDDLDHIGTIYTVPYDYIDNVQHSHFRFPVPSCIRQNSEKEYYYNSAGIASPPSTYVMTFFTVNKDSYLYSDGVHSGATVYTVTFRDVNNSSGASDPNDVMYGAVASTLKFGHYESIYTDAEAGDSVSAVRSVEIQGSVNKYASVFSAASKVNSNTQFFIDQSIVTLNSPDLEFDTELQRYNMDELGLRIVGVIPLTATASSHSIKTSSAMIETNYNSEDDNSHDNRRFGIGELSNNIVQKNISTVAYRRLITDGLWNDTGITVTKEGSDTKVVTDKDTYNYEVYPWHRQGPLNNDPRGKGEASSYLEHKRMANLWFSSTSEYLKQHTVFENTSIQIPLTENAEVMNYRVGSINYYPNIDKVLVNGDGYQIKRGDFSVDVKKSTDPISMRYKSTTHAVVALQAGQGGITPVMPGLMTGTKAIGIYSQPYSRDTFWGERVYFRQPSSIDLSSYGSKDYGVLLLGEIYRKEVSNRFGGDYKQSKYTNKWVQAGKAVTFKKGNNTVPLTWDEGDTYYQRYDCLKTYPFTEDDSNQIIEILSFMCETHVNIDGRYDRNRGQMNNVNMRPQNFNLLNPVYSQQNNFFTSRKIDTEGQKELSYPNQIYYSKTKQSGADVDLWTNVTLASTLELDGNKGELKALQRLNDQVIAFQESGIAQVLYNENVQIATTAGVPIEIANSGKVQGKRYISNTIGCSNKWSLCQTPAGIYFMDNNDKSIYLFNGQLVNVSTAKGFNAWCKQHIPSAGQQWNAEELTDFMACYDKMNQDVLFVNKNTALGYSEKFDCFTSFYDYGNVPFFENLDDTGVWIKGGRLWKHQAGEYGRFFGVNKPYSMTLVGNQEPQKDKIFTNMEFRACVEGDGNYDAAKDRFVPSLPFDGIEAWDEYQHGVLDLNLRSSGAKSVMAPLSRKFRIWRCDIPRDNAPISDAEALMGVKRFKVRPLDRIRNTWAYVKLWKRTAEDGKVLAKSEVHDVQGIYF